MDIQSTAFMKWGDGMHIYEVFRVGKEDSYDKDRKGNDIYGCPRSCIVRAASPKHAEKLARIKMDCWRFANLDVDQLDLSDGKEEILSVDL